MNNILDNLKYAKTHEWVKIDGDVAVVGISDYAQDNLGSIVYLEVGEVGDAVEQFQDFGAIESVKAATDLLSPITGEVVEINQDVVDNPELLNQDCYQNWIMKIRFDDKEELDNLLDAQNYKAELS